MLSTIIDYDIKERLLLNRKNESGYFILAVFTIFGILAVASIPGIILGITMSFSQYKRRKLCFRTDMEYSVCNNRILWYTNNSNNYSIF